MLDIWAARLLPKSAAYRSRYSVSKGYTHMPDGSTGARSGHALSLRNLSKVYGSLAAVDGVDLDVPRGSFLTLLGPSGSGKTTILMAIAGFVEPSGGSILLDDKDITRFPPDKRNFGMVFQGYALFRI